ITAVYSSVDYIAGWDFYFAGGSSRTADFYSNADNQVSSLILRNAEGSVQGWLDKSQMAAGGYEGKPAAVNWKALTDKYYYQMSFNATDFTDISVSSAMLLNYNAYSIQRIEYSIDGTHFTKLDSLELSTAKVWYPKTVTLPADANHAAKVYIRWIPNYNSAVVGTSSTNDGTSLAEIFVFGKTSVQNDGVAPVLVSSVPVNNGTGASTTGKVVLTFDEKVMTVKSAIATLGSKTLYPFVSGKTITFSYTGLDYNTAYTFTIDANKISDLGGNLLSTPVIINFTTLNRPVVTKKSFDFVVGVDGDFKAALTKAQTASSSGKRFYIFFPKGEYNVGANTGDVNQKTTIALPNVSYIGENADSVILYNKNTTEGIGSTATLYFTSSANNLYMQDLTLRNKDFRNGTSMGRCVALQDQGTKNIYKNVNVQSNQDTYYSGSGRLYFENSALHGTVDYLCGGGDVFFNECLLYLEERGGNCITAPATSSNWGYVFSGCTIDGFPINNGSYNLGRPWQNAPKAIYINTKMNVLPTAAGWTEMGVVPGLFAEYNSVTATGAIVDLSMRKKSFTYSGVTTPVNPYLTAEQAATYTIENVLGGTDAWQPKLYTDQAAAPVITLNGNTLEWAENNYVLCWAVFEDGRFKSFVETNSFSLPTVFGGATFRANYTVRAANEMGGLSTPSNTIEYIATGIENHTIDAIKISEDYFTIEGKRLLNFNGYKGVVLRKTEYSNGAIITDKIIKSEF
ncbi:MAG TPA: pectinesterase family protein, partial [Paludibacter sp.]|nr:pectinesterase family protein [Paludibacter sp.]